MWYALFYVVGIAVGFISSPEDVARTLTLLEPITLTALVASLLVPFAGFALTERWQQFAVKYAMVPIFGTYTVIVWKQAATAGILFFVAASAVHFGYWMSSIHSRAFRQRQFEAGLARNLPQTTWLIAALNVRGLSHLSDQLISDLLSGRSCSAAFIKPHLSSAEYDLLARVDEEITSLGR